MPDAATHASHPEPALPSPPLLRRGPSPAEGGGGRALVAVGITLFRPAPGQVEALLARLPAGLAAVLAFDNGGVSPDDRRRLADGGVTILSEGGTNLGIAAALNRLVAAARSAGAKDLLLLDQDAAPSPDLPAALLAGLDRLRTAGVPAAVVGPAPAASAGHKAPACPARPGVSGLGSLAPVQFLATSGSLIDLAVFERVGPFREDYFIDGVELEWCFRAWAAGNGCYLERAAAIPHRVGGGVIRFKGLAMPRQPPFRMATYLRNSVYGWRLPHVPLRWKLAQALYLPLQAALYWADSGFRPAILGHLARAARDGLLGRLGPPRAFSSEVGAGSREEQATPRRDETSSAIPDRGGGSRDLP